MNVWLDRSVQFADMVRRGRVVIIPAETLLLVLEDTELMSSEPHEYGTTWCLILDEGEAGFATYNVAVGQDKYERYA